MTSASAPFDRRAAADDARTSAIQTYTPIAGHVFAAALLFLGVLHVVFGEQVGRMLPAWPADLPGRPYWAYAMGALIACVAALMLAGGRRRGAALCLGALLLVPVVTLHLPRAIPTGTFSGEWLGVLKWLALAGGTAVFAAHVPASGATTWRDRAVTSGAALAPWLLSAFMIGSAILHVRHDEFVAQLMQPWMPWRMFWTYFAAVALAAGGIGLLIPKTARLAALMTSLMIFLWFLLVHTPRMLVDPTGPNGWSEIGESLAFSAMAFLLATRAVSGRASSVR
jgi:uncharacterized membrane protein